MYKNKLILGRDEKKKSKDKASETNKHAQPRAIERKYDEAYVASGFTVRWAETCVFLMSEKVQQLTESDPNNSRG